MSSSNGSISQYVGSAPAKIAAAVVLAAAAIVVPVVTGGGGGFTCDLNATVANFSTQVAAATTGQTVCLTQSSDYGTFNGVGTAITIRPTAGVSPTMQLNLNNGDDNFTIDGNRTTWGASTGLTITSADYAGTPGPQDVTVKDTLFTNSNASGAGGLVEISGPTSTGDVFDHDIWTAIGGDNTGTCQPSNGSYPSSCMEAAIRFSYDGPSGMTIENSLFHDMAADAVKVGASLTTVRNNVFYNVAPDNADKHTDNIQICCGYAGSDAGSGDLTITGNYVGGTCEQGIGAFDGTGDSTVEHNVVVGCTAHSLAMQGDSPASTVEWNTLIGTGDTAVECGTKTGGNTSLTAISNNIAPQGITTSGPGGPTCTPSVDTHNMFTSASSPDFAGSATYIGGSSPTTFAGACLDTGSAGLTGATDGGQVGACGNSFTGGPPENYP